MMLIGTIGMFGLGTLLIGELPKRLEPGGLVAAAVMAAGLGSLALGLGFPLVASAFGGHLPEISGTPARLALFAVGVALTGASLVFDESTIGLMRGGVQLSRNLAMSVIKLLALPVTAVVLHDAFGVGLILAWVLGTVLSLVPAAIMLAHGGSTIFRRPDWLLLRRLRKVAIAHNWLNIAIAVPPKLIPVLVTVIVSPSANAAFYVAWMLASFLFMVPTHLSTVLFAIVSAAPEMLAEKLRSVLRLSIMIGIPAMVALALVAHFALNIFGAGYAHLATVPLWLLILSYIPGLPKTQYIAVCRATGRVNQAAVLLAVACGCELGAVVIGGKLGGLNGLSLAYLGVTVVEGIVTAPTVMRAANARGRQRHAPTGGMAALAALASAAVSEGYSLDAATEVWRTGLFPAIAPDDGHPTRMALAITNVDLFGGGPGERPPGLASYRGRQEAGLEALIALATPVADHVQPHPGSRAGTDSPRSPAPHPRQ